MENIQPIKNSTKENHLPYKKHSTLKDHSQGFQVIII